MTNLKEQYWKYSLIILILVMGFLLFRELSPFMSGFLGACTIYVLVRKQMFYLTTEKKFGKGLSAILILIETILCFLIPVSFAIWLLIVEVKDIKLDPAAYVVSIQHFADLIQEKIGYDLLSRDNILKLASYLPRVIESLIGNVSSFVINALVMVLVLYFMLIGGKDMENYLYDLLPFDDRNKKDIIKEINMMVRSNAIGIPLLAILQGIVATIGYVIFGAPDPLLFGFITCFATIIPLLGTALVWFPLALYLVLSGHTLNGIGLAAYALIVISNSDNLIRFVLQKKMADTNPLITIFGVVIGLTLFGFWGVIFGPLLLSIFILCVNIFKREYLDSGRN